MTTGLFPDGELDQAAELAAIDHQSVRVWVRQVHAPEVSATLEVESCPLVLATTRLTAETDWTGALVLTLPEPAPDRPFVCSVGGRQLRGRMAPRPGAPAAFTFAFGSCHHPYKDLGDGRVGYEPTIGIYPAMADELRDAAFLLLIGDQIYSEDVEPISIQHYVPEAGERVMPLSEMVDAYRRVSRGYFAQKGLRALRERVPTLCIWDDHDIFDDWGSLWEESPAQLRLFEAASRVYCEYQHQRNPGGEIGLPPYHYVYEYGDVGFLVLDVRGARDYRIGQLLGSAQWDAVQAFLRSERAARLQTLFVVSTVPIAHTARWVGLTFAWLPMRGASAVRDRWSSPHFTSNRDSLLAELFLWQATEPTRQVIVLSGDIHMAGAATIRQRRGGGVIEQFISSALTTPLTWHEAIPNHMVRWGQNLIEPLWHFDSHFLVGQRNFGLMQVEPLDSGGHRVTFTVRAWQEDEGKLYTAAQRHCVPRNCESV